MPHKLSKSMQSYTDNRGKRRYYFRQTMVSSKHMKLPRPTSVKLIAAMTSHASLKEIERYTNAADQERLADMAMSTISQVSVQEVVREVSRNGMAEEP